MSADKYKIFPLGTNALTIEFGSEISEELNDRAINLADYFAQNHFQGLIETVPAYASLTLFFDVFTVKQNFPDYRTAFDAVENQVANALKNLRSIKRKKPRLIEIPVDFSPPHAPDLPFVGAQHKLTEKQVIEIFTAKTYRVYMLGFLPGFAYMGEVDERLAAPRKQAPRLTVPRGSVGIAGRQTGIYPFDSPGGWQIIGRTDFELFTPHKEKPCALEAGDAVKFYAVSE